MLKNKQILLEKYIKVAIRKQLAEQEKQHKQAEKALYLAYRFPHLREMLEDLMSPIFGRYLKNITIVAPKPTTFKIELINNQEFNIIYIGKKHFTIKVSGKKYNPDNLGELERASQSIADLLQLNYAPEEGKDQPSQQDDLANDLKNASSPSPSTTSSAPSSEPEQVIPTEEPIDNEEPAEEEAETVKI